VTNPELLSPIQE